MQEHAWQPRSGQVRQIAPRGALVEVEIAVLVVAQDRKAQVRQVNADLVGATGLQFGLQQRVAAEALLHVEDRVGGHAGLRVDRHASLAVAGQVLGQRRLHVLAIVLPVADDQRQIALVDLSLAQHLVQPHQRAPGLGEQQDAGGLAVEPVRQFEERLMWPRRAHLLDQTERHPAAAMRGQAGRLVDRDQVLVLVQDGRHVRPRLRPPAVQWQCGSAAPAADRRG